MDALFYVYWLFWSQFHVCEDDCHMQSLPSQETVPIELVHGNKFIFEWICPFFNADDKYSIKTFLNQIILSLDRVHTVLASACKSLEF